MTVYQISYDLHSPQQHYEELHEAIEGLGPSTHILDSVWLIDVSSLSAGDIRDRLKNHIDGNDRLLVVKKADSGSTWATTFSDDSTDWLHDR